MTLNEIAFLLGLSEQSVFNHAFKRWTGFSPGEYQTMIRKIGRNRIPAANQDIPIEVHFLGREDDQSGEKCGDEAF